MRNTHLEALRNMVKNNGISYTVQYLSSLPDEEKANYSFAYNSGYVIFSLLVHLCDN